MARLGAPLDPGPLAAALAKLVTITTDHAGRIARAWSAPTGPASADQQAQRDRFHAAAAQWHALKPWKRARWSLCALRMGQPANPPAGFIGWSGFTLYAASMMTQQTTPGSQPISPCSRRATSTAASPHDWTP